MPYTIIVVDLDNHPGVRFIAHFQGTPALEIGTPVEVEFTDLREGFVIPDWRLAGADA